jgi:hypothetical protein
MLNSIDNYLKVRENNFFIDYYLLKSLNVLELNRNECVFALQLNV